MEEKMESSKPEKSPSGNTNYWIIGVVALVVLLGIIWYSGAKKKGGTYSAPVSKPTQSTQQSGQPAGDAQKPAAAVIEYTDSGFSSQSVTIKAGDTVTFTNNSSGGMWVASAPHPVHTDYPEFDAKKTYNQGETYSFIFEKAGTWKFHNHLDPTKFGSITVE